MKRSFLGQTLLLGLACSIFFYAAGYAASPHRSGDRLLGSSIKDLMARYGLPTRIEKLQRNMAAYHWQLKATMVFDESGDSRTEEFECNVTAVTTPQGRIVKLQTHVADAGAGVLAAVGAFGLLCDNSFGLKSSRKRS